MTLLAPAADSSIVEFFNNHLVLMALTASAAWFYAGKDYFRKGNLVGAFLWQGIAILILIAFCINVVLSPARSWFSFTLAIVAIGVEIWLMQKWCARKDDAADWNG